MTYSTIYYQLYLNTHEISYSQISKFVKDKHIKLNKHAENHVSSFKSISQIFKHKLIRRKITLIGKNKFTSQIDVC